MCDEMNVGLAGKRIEADTVTAYHALMVTNKRTIDALAKDIETEPKHVGKLGFNIVQMKPW